jgi:hypothetical protein
MLGLPINAAATIRPDAMARPPRPVALATHRAAIYPHKPYWIRILFPDGDPDGLRTIEKSNWNGTGIIIPRTLLRESKQSPEFARTGVYVLVGPPEESGLPRIYVGEGDPIKPRLEQHAAKKDFWTSCIAFTSKDGNLNKAHVQFIESRLIELAAGQSCRRGLRACAMGDSGSSSQQWTSQRVWRHRGSFNRFESGRVHLFLIQS